MFMNIVSADMAGLAVSATTVDHTCGCRWLTHCDRRYGRPHYVLWAPDGWLHLLLWAPNGWPNGGFPFVCGRLMAGRTFSCGRLMAGLTEVSPFRLNLLSPLWAPDGWYQLLLWAPDGWPHGGSHPNLLSPLWAPDGCPQLLLWEPDG